MDGVRVNLFVVTRDSLRQIVQIAFRILDKARMESDVAKLA